MRILGISAFYHDSAAALIEDGQIVAAAQEERFTRKKNDANFPRHAIEFCLTKASASPPNIDYIVFYDKPFLKFERLIETYLALSPRGFSSFERAIPLWAKEKIFQKLIIRDELRRMMPDFPWKKNILFSEHHQSHAASAFFPSPYSEAAVLCIDGVGEWATTSISYGHGNQLFPLKEIHFPHSLGLLYSAFTAYVGFKVNSGEYKVMGLAPYGTPRFEKEIFNHLIDLRDDGSFSLDLTYFDYCAGLRMTNEKFHDLFGGKPRDPTDSLTQRDIDLAASIQSVAEKTILQIAYHVKKETNSENLCLAGGVALNCAANGKLLKSNLYKNIWVQPAAGDAGGSIGAALAAYHLHLERPRTTFDNSDRMSGSLLGPQFNDDEIESELLAYGLIYKKYDPKNLIEITAEKLADQSVVGWMQGRMEFGPRALGARSILADARSPFMKDTLNSKIKYREAFRPFAPAVIEEDANKYFEILNASPYMAFTAPVKEERCLGQGTRINVDEIKSPRSDIPAVTHVDFSARVQTVDQNTHPLFYALLNAFKRKTGSSVLVNTSFNIRGEPIVCTPADAIRCFLGCDLDGLAIGNFYLNKSEQPRDLKINYRAFIELD